MRLMLSVVVMCAVSLTCEAGDRRKAKCDPAVAMAWSNPVPVAVAPGRGCTTCAQCDCFSNIPNGTCGQCSGVKLDLAPPAPIPPAPPVFAAPSYYSPPPYQFAPPVYGYYSPSPLPAGYLTQPGCVGGNCAVPQSGFRR